MSLRSISHRVELKCDLCGQEVRYDQNQESITGWWVFQVTQSPYAYSSFCGQRYDVCDMCVQTLPPRMREMRETKG